MPRPDPATTPASRRPLRTRLVGLGPWLLAGVTFVTLVVVASILLGKMRREVWVYHTDESGRQIDLKEDKARPVLWEDPQPNYFREEAAQGEEAEPPDPVNQPTGRLEASFSADGTMMVLVRWDENRTNADMVVSHWDGRTWSRPAPIAAVNSPANERGPALSRDGNHLYFCSNRSGGQGGYDIYVARWNGREWAGVEALGETINTASNELGPALSWHDQQLFFSSDRGSAGSGPADIFVAIRVEDEITPPIPEQEEERSNSKRKGQKNPRKKPGRKTPPGERDQTALPPVPRFAAAEPVSDLNSEADDLQAAMTKRGDHVFLASDRERNRKVGFEVYLSRVVDGKAQKPEKIDLYIDEGNVTDPAVRMEGFDLLFSADQKAARAAAGASEGQPPGFRLYRSTTREVIGYTDWGRWEQFKTLLRNIAWWILLAIVALIALLYLLEHWHDITSLFHKCLAGSLAIHLIALLLMMIWLIAVELDSDAEPPSAEIEISIDALAQEQLALESVPEEAQLTDPDTALPTRKEESGFDIPKFEPQDSARTNPIESSTPREAMDFVVQPTRVEPADQPEPAPVQESDILNQLSETVLPAPEPPRLEERDPQEEVTAATPENDQFQPEEPVPQTTRAEARPVDDRAVETPTEVTEIEPTESVTIDTRTSATEVTPETSVHPAIDQPPPTLDSEMLDSLPETAFVDPNETALEENDPNNPQETNSPANPSEDLFAPSESMAKVEPNQTATRAVVDSAVETNSNTSEVAGTSVSTASTATEVTPSELGQGEAGEAGPEAMIDAGLPAASLPETALTDPGSPQLEESDPNREAAGNPADSAADLFQPSGSESQLATVQVEGQVTNDSALPAPSTPAEVANGSVTTDPLHAEVRPAEIGQAPTDETPPDPGLEAAASLPETALLDPGTPRLEESDPNQPAPGSPADATKDLFQPPGSPSPLATVQAEGQTVRDSAVTQASRAAEVADSSLTPNSTPGEIRPADLSRPLTGGSAPDPSLDAGAPAATLPEVALLDPGAPRLEESDPHRQESGTPADTAGDLFKPDATAPKLATVQAEGPSIRESAVTAQSTAAAVASGRVTTETTRSEIRPSDPGRAQADQAVPHPSLAAGLPSSSLPDTALLDPGAPRLEESDPDRQAHGTPADAAKDLFRPTGSPSQLVTTQASARTIPGKPVPRETATAQVGRTATGDAKSSQVTARPGLESGVSLPELALGPASLDAPNGPPLPGQLEAPNQEHEANTLAKFIRKQRGKPSLDTVKQLGGSDGTEKAISAAIKWLTENQEEDGRWDTRKHGAKGAYDTGGTGLALLCYYGWGARHDRPGEYQQQVRKAVDWLLSQQADDGDLGGPGLMYCHAIAAIALCEAYGITKDPKLKVPSEKAIAYTIAAQSPSRGGWRYHPGDDSDTSITGWQYMALHSARMAGLVVPESTFTKARRWLDRVGGGRHGGLYGYQGPGRKSPAMVATGMFCRQLDLVPPGDPKMAESAQLLKMRPMDPDDTDLYYVYYATLALYQHQGPIWGQWNEQLKEVLPLTQRNTGTLAGSWNPSAGITKTGGRVASTALATLSLEVYYRLLPMYGFRNEDAAPPPKVKGAADNTPE